VKLYQDDLKIIKKKVNYSSKASRNIVLAQTTGYVKKLANHKKGDSKLKDSKAEEIEINHTPCGKCNITANKNKADFFISVF